MALYSIIIPVFNSEKSIGLLLQKIEEIFSKKKINYEVILIDDASLDNSWNTIYKIYNDSSHVKLIRLSRNFGQHNAIMCGLHFASGDFIITMDDDLQHPPEEAIKLIRYIQNNKYDVVYGQYKVKKHKFIRSFFSHLVNKLIAHITNKNYKITSFRIFRRSVLQEIIKFKQYNVMIDVLISSVVSSNRIGMCKVEHHARTLGKSNYNFKKLAQFAVNMIFNFTILPLRISVFLGIFFSFVSMLLGIYYILYYFIHGISVSGWTSLILSIFFFSGLILFVLGIIGEYIGKMYQILNDKPQYVIRELYEHE